LEHVYKKIRALRIQQELTLKDLSEKSGFSVSFLSQVERGNSSLAITSLQKIAECLGVPITYFFEVEKDITYHTPIEKRQMLQIEGSPVKYVRIGGNFPDRALEPLLNVLPPGQMKHVAFQHPGEEFYYVVKGCVTIVVDGTEYHLEQGDTIHFPSSLLHTWYNPSTVEEAEILSVLTPVIFRT
jgi:transcriptional regulator with XRE-family HTH domain